MKLNIKRAGLIGGVVCVILLILLMLTMGNGGEQNEVTTPVETTEAAGETAGVETEAAEETEATEATEEETESTEATEEATEPTVGGNTTPGGTGGYGGGGNDTDEPAETNPQAGSKESPYTEMVVQFPDVVNTVLIPGEGVKHYVLDLMDETVETYGESLLTIESEDAYVVYKETKYQPKNGVVSVPLAAATEEEAFISIQIGNSSKEGKMYALSLDAPLGTKDNPAPARSDNGEIAIDAMLEAADADGYHYGFLAERAGTLKIQLDSATEDVSFDIIASAGTQKQILTAGGEATQLTMDFAKGEEVTVQVLAKAGEEGTIPALQAKLSGSAHYYGSEANPIAVEADFVTEKLEPGQVLYYLVKNQAGMAVNVTEPAYIIYNGKTYKAEEIPEPEPPEAGEETEDTETTEPAPQVISVKIGNADTAALVAIGNGGEEAAAVSVTMGYPAGHEQNKAPMKIQNVDEEETGVNTAVVEAGDTNVYWYSWTNEADAGLFTFQIPEGTWKYQILHTSNGVTKDYGLRYSDDVDVPKTVELILSYNDVVELLVSTYDPADKDAYPAGSVEFTASFLEHVLINGGGETYMTLEGGALTYCKQGLKYADGAIMTIKAVAADEEGNALLDEDGNVTVLTDRAYTIDYEGTIYEAENGVIVVEGIKMESSDPDIFSFVNDSAEKTTYQFALSYPLGHQTNPIPVNTGDEITVTLYGDGGSGTYYQWIATEPGRFVFEIDPSTVWSYNITSTKDTSVMSSINNGATTDYVTYVELIISQSHLDESSDGTVRVNINVGNPSSDATKSSVVTFKVNSYRTKIAAVNTSFKVAPGQTWRLMQELEDPTAEAMTITGAGDFTVMYNGTEYVAVDGMIRIDNLLKERVFFQVVNHSDAEQTYQAALIYPLGSQKNPESLPMGALRVDLKGLTERYYTWTAPADGTFALNIANTYAYYPWVYEIQHGETTYTGRKLNLSITVAAGDVLTMKLTCSRVPPSTTMFEMNFSFTEVPATLSLTNPAITKEKQDAPEIQETTEPIPE